jgi:hypothetical protein
MTFSFLTRVVVVRAESPEAEKPAGNWQAFFFFYPKFRISCGAEKTANFLW